MSSLDDLENKLEKDIRQCDDFIEKTSELNKAVPYVQEYKEGKETSLEIIRGLPQDIAEEYAPKFLVWEKENDEMVKFPDIPNTPSQFIEAVDNSTGSATPYIVNASSVVMEYSYSADECPDWIANELLTIHRYTEKIQQRENLPIRLNKINNNLGEMFKEANNSYIKCKNKIISVDQAAIQLRDVIEQVWGGLVNMARKLNTDSSANLNRLELKKEGDRSIVSGILANKHFSKIKLDELLFDAYNLFRCLSDRNFGKNILCKDYEKLELYHSQWIAFLDSVSRLSK